MEQLLAYCGLICDQCPAFVATKAGDRATLRALAAEWSQGGSAFKPDDLLCDGCKAGSCLFTWCHDCGMRSCASERGVLTCAHCPDYACDFLQDIFVQQGPDLKMRLDAIHAGL